MGEKAFSKLSLCRGRRGLWSPHWATGGHRELSECPACSLSTPHRPEGKGGADGAFLFV